MGNLYFARNKRFFSLEMRNVFYFCIGKPCFIPEYFGYFTRDRKTFFSRNRESGFYPGSDSFFRPGQNRFFARTKIVISPGFPKSQPLGRNETSARMSPLLFGAPPLGHKARGGGHQNLPQRVAACATNTRALATRNERKR